MLPRLNSYSLDSKKQLDKIHNSSLNTTHSARNLGFIFDEHLAFSDQISAISKSCYYHVSQLRCIRPYLDSTTACTIATSIVYSKLNYCKSLYYNLPKSQITRLQQIQNSFVCAVVKAPKSCHVSSLSLNHHLIHMIRNCSFHHPNFDSSITHLQNALQEISSLAHNN